MNNQNGFTLTNMVVGLAIGGIVMAAFVSTVQIMTRGKQNQDVKIAASLFIDELQQATRSKASCKANLANGANSIDPSISRTERQVSFGNVSVGTEIAKNVKVSKLSLKSTGNSVAVPGSGLHSVGARLEVVITNNATNPPTLLRSRFVPMQVVYDASTMIQSCADLDLSAQVCAQLDGQWDPSAPPGLNCMPTDKCLYGGSYSLAPLGGVDANGVLQPGFINTFTGGTSCPVGFSAQQTGTVSVARKASKYQVVTDTYPNFTCVRCSIPVVNQALTAVPITGVNLDPTGQGLADTWASDSQGGAQISNIDIIRHALGFQ